MPDGAMGRVGRAVLIVPASTPDLAAPSNTSTTRSGAPSSGARRVVRRSASGASCRPPGAAGPAGPGRFGVAGSLAGAAVAVGPAPAFGASGTVRRRRIRACRRAAAPGRSRHQPSGRLPVTFAASTTQVRAAVTAYRAGTAECGRPSGRSPDPGRGVPAKGRRPRRSGGPPFGFPIRAASLDPAGRPTKGHRIAAMLAADRSESEACRTDARSLPRNGRPPGAGRRPRVVPRWWRRCAAVAHLSPTA